MIDHAMSRDYEPADSCTFTAQGDLIREPGGPFDSKDADHVSDYPSP